MHLSYYAHFITELSAVIDSGKYQNITVNDVLRGIEGENLISWLKSKLKDDIDLSFFEENAELAQKLNQELLELYEGYSGTKWGIKNYVKFLGGVEQEKVLDLYKQAHIFLLSSVTASNGDREGQALVLQEAQAVGLPIISTIHNGIPEGVRDGISGFLVPERDVEALVDRLIYLIKNQELWPHMGRAGRELVEKNYNIEKLCKRLVKMYQELIKKS